MQISAHPPESVRYPAMLQSWRDLTFFHWPVHPSVIAPHIPAGLDVDMYDGSAWISLTPFLIDNLRPPLTPGLPWISRFPETNLRTYVRDRTGYGGIWFFSLEAARAAAVLGARLSYRLPYMWSKMRVQVEGNRVRYLSARR